MKPSRDVRRAHLVRTTQWLGASAGDVVVIGGAKERHQYWVFVAHVRNSSSGEEWVEVRGGRKGEAKGRAFHPELIYPAGAVFGSRLTGPSFVAAPRLQLADRPTKNLGRSEVRTTA